ncbi:MAG: deoxyribonuclease IV [Holophagales bacterium]|nr:deoxyribonuclease IV [Holophagales bacterium]MBK9965483.1 deoxyribonuclease IV [Holophagales bacterium]
MTKRPTGAGPLVGAHMSAAGGLARAVERAVAAGCRTLQVFTKNSNQWAGKPIVPSEAKAFQRAAAEAGLAPLVSHSAYLINLASPDPVVRARSADALVDEIERCDANGIPFLVLHPGSHGGEGEEVGLDRIARGLDDAAAKTPSSRTTILLETAAGQGACLGHDFAHLAAILARADSRPRLALCLDTCHIHAAGYDIVTKDGWRSTLDALDSSCGLGLVKVIHANDSKKERGCRVDRHERIGLGQIGEKGFVNLMTEAAFEDVPKILETPKDEEGRWDREGLAALRKLARRKGPA